MMMNTKEYTYSDITNLYNMNAHEQYRHRCEVPIRHVNFQFFYTGHSVERDLSTY